MVSGTGRSGKGRLPASDSRDGNISSQRADSSPANQERRLPAREKIAEVLFFHYHGPAWNFPMAFPIMNVLGIPTLAG